MALALAAEVALALAGEREAAAAVRVPVAREVEVLERVPAVQVPAALGVVLEPEQEAVLADQEPVRALVEPARAAVSVLDPVRRWAQPLDPAPMPRSALVPMLPLVLARMLQSVRVQVLRKPQGLRLASRPEKVRLSAMAPAMGPVTRGLGPKTELVSDQGPEPAAL